MGRWWRHALPPLIAILLLLFADASYDILAVTGQAHFFMAYLYRAKSGKIDARAVVVWLGSATALLLAWQWGLRGDDLAMSIAALFVLHFAADQLHLIEKAYQRHSNGLAGVRLAQAGFCLTFFGAAVLRPPVVGWVLLLASAGLGLTVAGTLRAVRMTPHTPERALAIEVTSLFLCYVGMGVALLWAAPVPAVVLLPLIVLAHFADWYVTQAASITRAGRDLVGYCRTCAWVNVASLCIFGIGEFVLRFGGERFVLAELLFHPDSFHIWTGLHYVAVARPTLLRLR